MLAAAVRHHRKYRQRRRRRCDSSLRHAAHGRGDAGRRPAAEPNWVREGGGGGGQEPDSAGADCAPPPPDSFQLAGACRGVEERSCMQGVDGPGFGGAQCVQRARAAFVFTADCRTTAQKIFQKMFRKTRKRWYEIVTKCFHIFSNSVRTEPYHLV